MESLPKLKTKRTLAEQIYETLKKAIIELNLKPGELITEEDLSERLGVSRTPLRTAINKLIHEDLIVLIPGKGTFISELTNKQLQDIFQARSAIEMLSVQLAVEHRTEEDVLKLKQMIDAQAVISLDEPSAYREYFDADIEIHAYIATMGKNEYLVKILKPIMINCSRYLYTTISNQTLGDAVAEHYEIYECIKRKDREKAAVALQKHITNSSARLMSNLIKNNSNTNF